LERHVRGGAGRGGGRGGGDPRSNRSAEAAELKDAVSNLTADNARLKRQLDELRTPPQLQAIAVNNVTEAYKEIGKLHHLSVTLKKENDVANESLASLTKEITGLK